MAWIPCLVLPTADNRSASLGDPDVDDYLQFVAARAPRRGARWCFKNSSTSRVVTIDGSLGTTVKNTLRS